MRLCWTWLCLVTIGWSSAVLAGEPFSLQPKEHVCFIGNTTAELMQHHGWLETLLHARYPQHELVVRHLGYSADELDPKLRLRSSNFGTTDEWLSRMQADVVFAFFGYNESFAGAAGLEKFSKDLETFVKHTKSQQYNGRSAPRLVLFGPLAHEDLKNPNLPDGRENNDRLKLYHLTMQQRAVEFGVDAYVPLFDLSVRAYAQAQSPLTDNGIHLNAAGDRVLASLIDATLFELPHPTALDQLSKLHAAVVDKNFYWYQRYRVTDGFSIYGGRADTPKNGIVNRPVMARELEVLDVLTANRDAHIWALSQGRDQPIDDSNTPPFIDVPTNKPGPGPNGEYTFVGGEAAIEMMTIHPELKVQLFASEEMFPDVISPVQMAFDTRGRLWVATWPSYPHWKPKDPYADKLLILEDTNGDGRADKCTTFAGDLQNPTGFEFWGGGVIVAQAPDLVFLKDTNGDDKYDIKQSLIHGLDTADTHHTSNSFTLDPGGALYFQEGTFHHTQVETPWGAARRVANGAVFRYEPRAMKFDIYVSHGFANPHGHVFDRWGDDVVIDGTGAVPYHGALFSGHVEFPRKHRRPPTVYKQRTRPCPGLEILSSRHFPDDMRDNLVVPNVIGFQGLLRYKLEHRASSLAATELEPILSSTDPLFRPADVEVAPDGSLYFTDWYNPLIGHLQHNLRDPNRNKTRGRVYRVTHQTRPVLQPLPIAGQPIPALLDLLKQPEDRVRCRAKIELSALPTDDVIRATKNWVAGLNSGDADYQHQLLEALWVHQHHNVVDLDLLDRLLASPEPLARAAAARVLCYWRDRVPSALEKFKRLATDESGRVRLEAIRAASFFAQPEALEVVLLAGELPSDEYLAFVSVETTDTLQPLVDAALKERRPIAFTSAAGARFLLSKTSTEELLKAERTRPVCLELLYRSGLRDDQRQPVLATLAKLENRTELAALLEAIRSIDRQEQRRDESIVFDLVRLLKGRSTAELTAVRGDLEALATSAQLPIVRQAGYVALMNIDGRVEPAWALASRSVKGLRDILAAVPMMADASLRAALYPAIEPLLHRLPAGLKSPDAAGSAGGTGVRYVRIELPGKATLTLAEVEVLVDGKNIARAGKATQKNTAHGGDASRAIDGNRDSDFNAKGQTHTSEGTDQPWWELDLGQDVTPDAIVVYNRGGDIGKRLDGFTLRLLDARRQELYKREKIPAPMSQATFDLTSISPEAQVRRAAMEALAAVRGQEAKTFESLADFVRRDVDRGAAIRALQRLGVRSWPKEQAQPLVDVVLDSVRKTPPLARTAPAVRDQLEFADTLASLLPDDVARRVRAELGELGVRVVRLNTVLERMSYDKDLIAVQAGKPVEIVFENTDMMPHNLVVTRPGALAEVGGMAEAQAQNPAFAAGNYVPNSKQVLLASKLLQPRETETLTFQVPGEPGVYPFVCTYPGHWRRMYGALYVVADLDSYLASPDSYLAAHPLAIKDELLADRRPRTEWKFDDLAEAVGGLRGGRSFGSGKQMFTVAACIACHKVDGLGNEFGPDLTKLDPKLKPLDILREVLEPSAKINEKYQSFVIETNTGKTITGLIVSETADAIRLIENPLAKAEPIDIKKSEVESRTKSTVSLMPKGLLDKLSRDEILELIAFLAARGDKQSPLFAPAATDHGH